MVVAVVALIVALSGTALGATKYVIRSTKQISPKVLKKLRGKSGATGPQGPKGDTGAKGDAGPSEVLVKDIADGSVSANPGAIGSAISPGAGSYLVRAQGTLTSGTSSSSQIIKCRIDTASTAGTPQTFWLAQLGQVGESIAVFAQRAVTLTAADSTVSFFCPRQAVAPNYSYSGVQITFTRVGAVTMLQ
jgi:hypothetical protein